MSVILINPFTFGAVSDATVSYRTQSSDVVDRSTYTFPSLDIGTASATRYVIVGVISSGTSPSVSSITVAGNSATMAVQVDESNLRIGLWIVAVASGTTGDVVVTHTGTMLRCGVVVWAAYDLASATPTATATDIVPTLSQSLTINAGGIGIGLADGYQSGGAQTWTWTELTENVDTSFNDGTNYDNMTGASLASAAGTTITVTATKTGSDANDCFVLAAFR